MRHKLYWLGNATKSRVIAEILAASPGPEPVTIFDYGCGDGGDWPHILADNPHLQMVGYEPYTPSSSLARKRLNGYAAKILGGEEIAELAMQADYIVSLASSNTWSRVKIF